MAKAKKSKAKKAKAKKSKAKKAKKSTSRAAAASRGKAKKTKAKRAKRASQKSRPQSRQAESQSCQEGRAQEEETDCRRRRLSASRSFLKDQANFVKRNSAEIPAMGKEAEAALEGPEGDSLRAAEEEATQPLQEPATGE